MADVNFCMVPRDMDVIVTALKIEHELSAVRHATNKIINGIRQRFVR
jgi:hypothetical protein